MRPRGAVLRVLAFRVMSTVAYEVPTTRLILVIFLGCSHLFFAGLARCYATCTPRAPTARPFRPLSSSRAPSTHTQASKSPTRRRILGELGFADLRCLPADIDEKAVGATRRTSPCSGRPPSPGKATCLRLLFTLSATCSHHCCLGLIGR
jgi:hypothetical protein